MNKKKYYLIGEQLSHSYSAGIHQRQGFNYKLKELPEDRLEEFIKAKKFDGLNVTIPYKEKVMQYLDEIDPAAKEAGAVNTVVNDGGKLIGYNTDIFGVICTLGRANIAIEDKNVVILGYGGMGKAVGSLVQRLGAKTITYVRRNGKYNYYNYEKLVDTQVIFNCTPVGMFPDDYSQPVDLSVFDKLEGVMDMVYNPTRTMLLQQAEELNVKHAGGLYMLVAQAFQSENLWSGRSVLSAEIELETRYLESLTENIAFIGMPGAGKSTAAKFLGEYLKREVVDTDDEITRNYGSTPEQIIDRFGESYFREIEERTVDIASQRRGVIIAVGGGAILSEKNRKMLRSNSKIIYIRRDISKLPTENRPISESRPLCEIYEERKDLYEKTADYTVENNGTFEDCAHEILAL